MARRSGLALLVAIAVAILVASTALAVKPTVPGVRAGSGCLGIQDAYSHAAPAAQPVLRRVADKHGCDLTGIEPVLTPGKSNHSDADQESDQPDADGEGHGPDVAAKCAKISEKVAEAALRTHGKSADAFGRQAERWGCDPV